MKWTKGKVGKHLLPDLCPERVRRGSAGSSDGRSVPDLLSIMCPNSSWPLSESSQVVTNWFSMFQLDNSRATVVWAFSILEETALKKAKATKTSAPAATADVGNSENFVWALDKLWYCWAQLLCCLIQEVCRQVHNVEQKGVFPKGVC